MKREKKARLTRKGWRVGSAQEFLGLTHDEARFVELKLALSLYLRQRRIEKRLTQQQLASLLESSQSRVAKMESGDPSVSLDLLIRALLQLGTTKKELARALERPRVA